MGNLPTTLDSDERRVPSEINTLSLTADILEVLCNHGFSPRIEDIQVTPTVQGGHVTGVSITGGVYERPAELGPGMTPDEYDAWISTAFKGLSLGRADKPAGAVAS